MLVIPRNGKHFIKYGKQHILYIKLKKIRKTTKCHRDTKTVTNVIKPLAIKVEFKLKMFHKQVLKENMQEKKKEKKVKKMSRKREIDVEADTLFGFILSR